MREAGIGCLLVINLTAFVLFGIDKRKAVKKKWRIPEATLLTVAALGGGAGALLGMYTFHHKTRKPKFYLGVPALLVTELVLLWYAASEHFFI